MTRVSDWIDAGFSARDRAMREIIAGRAAMQSIGASAAPGLPMSDDAVDRMTLRVAQQLYGSECEEIIDAGDAIAERREAFRFSVAALIQQAIEDDQDEA